MSRDATPADVLSGAARWCVVHGDAVETMRALPDRSVALVTDPPYGIGVATDNARRSRGNRPYDRKCRAVDFPPVYGDDEPFDPSPLVRFRNSVMWGANHYASRLPDSHCWLAWDRKTERGADSDITDVELAWTSGLRFKTVRIFRHMWAGFQRDSEVGQRVLHPTQKPVALMAWCVSFFDDDIILDPFAGSGTTGAAALRLGRRVILVEREAKWADLCRDRLEAEQDGSTLRAKRAGQVPLFAVAK